MARSKSTHSKSTRSKPARSKSAKSKGHKKNKSKGAKRTKTKRTNSKSNTNLNALTAFCMKCKQKNLMKQEGQSRSPKMNNMIKGLCSKCNGNVVTIVKKGL